MGHVGLEASMLTIVLCCPQLIIFTSVCFLELIISTSPVNFLALVIFHSDVLQFLVTYSSLYVYDGNNRGDGLVASRI